MGQSTRQQRTRERREERAERILDAAKELVLRLGYRKTTLDDIARQAGVGKGTLFLHWPNRDALFVSLLRRERVRMLTEFTEAVDRAPRPGTIDALFRIYFQAYTRSPLLKALLLGDQVTLGRLAERKRTGASSLDIRKEFTAYLEALRARGLVRDDLPAVDLLHSLISIFYGFAATPALTPEDHVPDDDRAATLCADAIARVVSVQHELSADQQAEMTEITEWHFGRMLDLAKEAYQASHDAPSAPRET